MASVYGFTELLLAQDFSDAERRDFLETIHRQSSLMIAIINELLDLVRIEERRGADFRFETLEAGDLVARVLRDFAVPAGRREPAWAPPESPWRIRGDRAKLGQAIGNVLSNAYKYSSGGEVSVAVVRAGGEIGVRIGDRGIGMNAEQLSRVCERFYRADTSGKVPGTGLGMAIVKEIVSLHGGRIELASDVGAGTTVILWLPAAESGA